jgi:hypothetical protein
LKGIFSEQTRALASKSIGGQIQPIDATSWQNLSAAVHGVQHFAFGGQSAQREPVNRIHWSESDSWRLMQKRLNSAQHSCN